MAGERPSAAQISVSEVLDDLDGDFANVSTAISEGRYALWLGSGISLDRVDDLKRVLQRVLRFLQTRQDPDDSNCPFRRALTEALDLAALSPAEAAGLDVTLPVEEWPQLQLILDRLRLKYSTVLDIVVQGQPEDYLLWEAVDIPGTFAAEREPDAEHMCVAVLAAEGVLPHIASANWDGLLEAAVEELGGDANVLGVCVRPEDLREFRGLSHLVKFHGCAVLAARQPDVYRSLLIARQSQITDWPNNAAYTVIQQQLAMWAATSPTLMIGLSAQDSNIQDIFSKAKNLMRWTWPTDPPANVFAGNVLGPDQKNILKVAYGDAYASHASEIESSSLLRAYGKPLLTALVLIVLSRKLTAFAKELQAPSLSGSGYESVCSGLTALRNLVASHADGDRLQFIRRLVRTQTWAIARFQGLNNPEVDQPAYRPLSRVPVDKIAAEPALATSRFSELAVALGLIGQGSSTGSWELALPESPTGDLGTFQLTTERMTTRVFFAATEVEAIKLSASAGLSWDDDRVLLVQCAERAPSRRRAPSGAPGRTGARGLRQVSVADILASAGDFEELRQLFKLEAAL